MMCATGSTNRQTCVAYKYFLCRHMSMLSCTSHEYKNNNVLCITNRNHHFVMMNNCTTLISVQTSRVTACCDVSMFLMHAEDLVSLGGHAKIK